LSIAMDVWLYPFPSPPPARAMPHASLRRPQSAPKRVDLVLIGARGRVGSAFRQRLAARHAELGAVLGLDLRLRAAFDRRGLAEHAQGLDPVGLESTLAPRRNGDTEALWERLRRSG